MNILKIADVPPAVVAPTVTVLEAIEEMVRKRVGAVAVVQGGHLVGVFSERDVMLRVVMTRRDPSGTKVVDVMTSKVETGTEDTTPGEALSLMLERHIRHLPIVDSAGRVLGMLSIRNLLQSRVDDLSRQLDSLESYLTADGPGG
jgi:CBS domain-containing protein